MKFMEALLPPSKYKTLLESGPTSWPMDSGSTKTFKEIFDHYGLWFNHVIKIEDKKMISVDHLWKFITRGAMILCATGQEGIDIVLPVHYTEQNLGPDSVTAVVIQVKNDQRYNATLSPTLFDPMDSVIKSFIFSSLGVDSVPDSDDDTKHPKKKLKVAPKPKMKPVIRLVFALASPEPGVTLRMRPEKRHHPEPEDDQLATFDIWLAGLSSETFKSMQEGDVQPYKTLLERSLMPHGAFKLQEERNKISEAARKVRGPCRRRMAPLALPGCSHHGIHLQAPKQLAGLEGSTSTT